MLTLCFSLQLMNLIHNNYKHREPYPEPGKATAPTSPPKKKTQKFPLLPFVNQGAVIQENHHTHPKIC